MLNLRRHVDDISILSTGATAITQLAYADCRTLGTQNCCWPLIRGNGQCQNAPSIFVLQLITEDVYATEAPCPEFPAALTKLQERTSGRGDTLNTATESCHDPRNSWGAVASTCLNLDVTAVSRISR